MRRRARGRGGGAVAQGEREVGKVGSDGARRPGPPQSLLGQAGEGRTVGLSPGWEWRWMSGRAAVSRSEKWCRPVVRVWVVKRGGGGGGGGGGGLKPLSVEE